MAADAGQGRGPNDNAAPEDGSTPAAGPLELGSLQGDLTRVSTDAIVNAANSSLYGGGGVDGAIHAAAGPRLLAACRQLRREQLPDGLPTGAAAVTPGFDLAARWVVHTVGPDWRIGQRDPQLLTDAFTSSALAADEVGARSVAFPAISAGVFGWQIETVAEVGVRSIVELARHDRLHSIRRVLFVAFSAAAAEQFRDQLMRYQDEPAVRILD